MDYRWKAGETKEEKDMLTSLALLFLVGILFSQILERLRLPGLLGMILTGFIRPVWLKLVI